MAYTVNPPVQINQVTGEEVAVPDSMRVEKHGEDVRENTSAWIADNKSSDPNFKPTPNITDPALSGNATDKQLNDFWTSDRALTNEEISLIQDGILKKENSEEAAQLARLLDYRVTGSTEALLPDDKTFLGIKENNLPDGYYSNQEIDNIILSTDQGGADPKAAHMVLNSNLGFDPASKVVQVLAYQYYSGKITQQDAYEKAYRSGVPHQLLYDAFNRLNTKLGGRKRFSYEQ